MAASQECMRHIRLVAAGLATITALAACGASSNAGSTQRGQLHIVATVAPTCPAQKAGEPPCVAPYRGKLEILDASGHRVAELTTSSAGTADISLAPGPYTIAVPRAGG